MYAAYDDKLDRRLALKLIRANRLGSEQATARTVREARALARLSHPHVVHVYEVGELDDRQIFVAMEFLAGPTLRDWLAGGRRSWQEVLAAYRQAGEGLAAAHAQGIIHRDFKPHNAMFGADGRVRVLDFGLAQVEGAADVAEVAGPTSRDLTRTLTTAGAVLGTPAYMAPEQFAAGKSDARTDQFSFYWRPPAGRPPSTPFGGVSERNCGGFSRFRSRASPRLTPLACMEPGEGQETRRGGEPGGEPRTLNTSPAPCQQGSRDHEPPSAQTDDHSGPAPAGACRPG